jgi:hypothetical protein
VQNLREIIERELTLHRAYLRVKLSGHRMPEDLPPTPAIALSVSRPVTARERRLPPARRLVTQTEISRQMRQNNQDLFDKFKALQESGLKISIIAQ